MPEWRVFRIGEIADIFDGPHATPAKKTSGPFFLSIASLKNGRLDLSESAHISDADFRKWTRRVTPRAGDVLFSYETRLGEAALMPEGVRGCLGRRMALMRPRPRVVNSRFLLYMYLSREFQDLIRRRAVHGATVDRIPLVDFPSWPIRLPSLATQQDIADLLGALDDKISINDRTAATALELAVSYFSDSAGEAAGSRSIPLDKAAKWVSGGTPRTNEPSYWDGDIPWISAASLKSPWIDRSDRTITRLGVGNGTRTVPARTVIFVVRGMSLKTEFRLGITQKEVAFGQDCKALIAAHGIDPFLLFYSLFIRRDAILAMVDEAGHGTGRLQTERLAQLKIVVPPPAEQQSLIDTIRPLSMLAARRHAESYTLADLRDALLPKLIAGRLRVRDAEKTVESYL